MIKTLSILNSIKLQNPITEIMINSFEENKITKVYFEELLNFKNLKTLYIENTIIDSKAINIIKNLNLENLYIINCEIINNLGEISNLNNLVFDSTNLNLINEIKVNNLTLKNVYIPNIKIIANKIDLSKANFNTIDNIIVNQLSISDAQYEENENLFNNLNCKVLVKKSNEIIRKVGKENG